MADQLGSGYLTGYGMTPVKIPPGLVGSGENVTGLAQETAGLTPEAQELAAQDLAQLQLEDDQKKKKALRAIFGNDFPLAKDEGADAQPHTTEYDWCRWADNRWEMWRSGVSQNILWAERNRLFRSGQQNLSPYGSNGVWRPAPMPKDAVRIIDNRIRPALAWAIEVSSEQRPGWRFEPTNTDPDRKDKAEAQQRAVEYQYTTQGMRAIKDELKYWAQTDGVSFGMTFWDPDKGPWEELEAGKGPVPLGDMGTKVYRIEQVRVSPEATANVKPMVWICRDIMPKSQAVALYGPDIVDSPDQQLLAQQVTQLSSVNQFAYTPLYQDQDTVARYTVFCEKSQWLPQGLTVVIVGKKLVFGPTRLLMGVVPMFRQTDGSEDPNFYPTPKMNTLIAPQMRINQLWSKWYESIRKNSGGRYATKTGAVSAETLIGGEVSMLEVRASGDIRESIMPVQGFSVGNDIKEALDREIQIIEQQTGYTKEARGQFTSDQSGKAILAIREQLERTFAPAVSAEAHSMTEWAKQAVGWMKYGYQMPRTVAVLGKDRVDLGVALSSITLDGVVDITVNEETLVPQPKALKQWLLDNAFDRGIITKEEWRTRSPIGDVKDIESPDKIQFAKAKRVVQQIKLGQPQELVVWQDNEGIQQNVLESDLILAGGIDPQIQMVAQQRWQELAAQAQKKKGPPIPQKGTPLGDYTEFITKIKDEAVQGAEALVSQAIENIALFNAGGAAVAGMAMPPDGSQPPQSGVLPMKPQAPQGSPPNAGPRRLGKPMNPRVAPVSSGAASPSVATAPSSAAGIGV